LRDQEGRNMKNYIFALLVIMCLASSKEKRETGPQAIHYGEDVCERCKMIISDKRFAAQYITKRGEAKKFDDIGCMIDELKEGKNSGYRVLAIYVTDYDTGEWIDAGGAYYLRNTELKTPMGYGIAAFGSEESLRSNRFFKGGQELGRLDDLLK
ncbi:MAG: nitrous oxide reductase accessory protein NosL, partial [Thermodesulfobacteriota bacterium]